MISAQDEHFRRRSQTWTQRYSTRPSFQARLVVVGQVIRDLLSGLQAPRVLDYGGGTGLFSELAARSGAQVVCIDRSVAMATTGARDRDVAAVTLDQAGFPHVEAGCLWRLVSDSHLPLALDIQFDVVLLISVLEYVDDPHRLLKLLDSYLAPEGVILATVPLPHSPVRIAQRLSRHLFLSVQSADEGRFADQGFANLRPHGDHVLWRRTLEEYGLRLRRSDLIPLALRGLRSHFHPNILLTLHR